jgi:hypothetical protein
MHGTFWPLVGDLELDSNKKGRVAVCVEVGQISELKKHVKWRKIWEAAPLYGSSSGADSYPMSSPTQLSPSGSVDGLGFFGSLTRSIAPSAQKHRNDT